MSQKLVHPTNAYNHDVVSCKYSFLYLSCKVKRPKMKKHRFASFPLYFSVALVTLLVIIIGLSVSPKKYVQDELVLRQNPTFRITTSTYEPSVLTSLQTTSMYEATLL